MSAIPPRFYAPDLNPDRDIVVLRDDEATHLGRVLRLGPGDEVRVFDGRGREHEAFVASIGRRDVSLRVGRRVDAARELSFTLTLAQSALKGDAFDAIVRDATMLGVTAIQPVVAARSEVTSTAIERSRRVDRWRRIAISSAKQCRRAVVPAIGNPLPFAAFVETPFRRPGGSAEGIGTAWGGPGDVALMLVEPTAVASGAMVSPPATIAPQPGVVVFVGPEGGWTEAEIDEAVGAGVKLVTLGGRTLRADAAALVALPVLLYAWGEL